MGNKRNNKMRIVYSKIRFIFNHFTQPIKINVEHFLRNAEKGKLSKERNGKHLNSRNNNINRKEKIFSN